MLSLLLPICQSPVVVLSHYNVEIAEYTAGVLLPSLMKLNCKVSLTVTLTFGCYTFNSVIEAAHSTLRWQCPFCTLEKRGQTCVASSRAPAHACTCV